MLRKQFLYYFNIKEEELRKTILLTIHIFLIITSLLVIKPTINSLFLSELTSAALPLGYVLTSLAAVVGSYFYNKMVLKKVFNEVIELTLFASIISLIIFGLAFKMNLVHGFLLYIPYIWIAIFGLITASQFWILANLVYNIRVAKRVFGFIGAGAILGGIIGGYLTSFLTYFLEAEDLLFVAAFLLVFCIPIVQYIWTNEVVHLNSFQKSLRSEVRTKKTFALIRQSKLLTLISLVIGFSVIVAKLIDYQYSYYASRLIDDPEDLASFFGFWFSTLSIVSLFVQLFVTKRVVGVFGVGKSLLWLPIGILIGTTLLIIIPQLWVIVLIKIIEGSLKNSVNKSATELLSIPVPIDIKKRTKTFIDVVVDSVATGIAGFILIFFINGLNIPSVYISLLIILFISVWIYFIFQLRKEYINSFKDLFTSTETKKVSKQEKSRSVLSIASAVRQVFSSESETQILFMLQKTLEAKQELFFPEIKKLLVHPSAKVRALAIENMYYLNSENLSSEIERMLYDDDQAVTTAAFRYILKYHKEDLTELFDKYLYSDDETISNGALIGLSIELRNYTVLQEKFNFHHVLQSCIAKSKIESNPTYREHQIIAILQAIGNARAKFYYPFIKEHLKNESPLIVNTALISAGLTLDSEFIDLIAEKLVNKQTRNPAVEALCAYGELIIDDLVSRTVSGELTREVALFIPQVIGNFSTQRAIIGLMKLIDEYEHSIKIQALANLTKLKWNNSHLEVKEQLIIARILDECQLYHQILTVFHSQLIIREKKARKELHEAHEIELRNKLIQVLETRMDRQLERIFKFLGLKFPPQEIDEVFNIIVSGKHEQRIQAIEFLDNILDIQLKKELIPIAESTLLEVVSKEDLVKLNIKVLSEKESFKILLQLNDVKIKLAVLALIQAQNNASYIPLLETLLNVKENKRIREGALAIITSLSNQ